MRSDVVIPLVRWFGRTWAGSMLCILLTAGAVAAQAGTSESEALPAGSLIIPMDNAKQAIGSAFNLAAYGLAVELLYNDIPVKWSISDTKAKDGNDFTANAARIAPSVLAGASLDFGGGPFVVHAAYADAARPIITAFARNVAVYETTEPTTIPVRYMLLHKPTPWVNTQSSNISTGVLDRAGITRYTVGPDNELAAETCHTIIIEPHNTDLVGLPAIQAFLRAGGNFYAQCASVVSFENGAVGTSTPFLTTLGITANNSDLPFTYMHPSFPFSQFIGEVDPGAAGSVRDWSLSAGSAFNPGAENHLRTTPTIWAGSVVDVTPGLTGGYVFYLGGHDYGATSTALTDINAHRMLLNAIMVPAVRLGVCNVTVPIPDLSLQKTGPASFAGPEGTYTLTVSNVGTATAPDALMVTDTLPAGLNFVSAEGAGWTFQVDSVSQVVVATNPVLLAVGAQTSFTITAEPTSVLAGTTVTNRAWLAEQSESNLDNNVATYTSQVPGARGIVFEDFNQNGTMDGDEVGLPGIRVVVTSGGPPVEADTDENGVWQVAGVLPGAAVATVNEGDLPAGAFQTAGDNPSDFTALTAGLADGGMDGYAGLLTNLTITKIGPATAVVSDTVNYVITTTNAGPAVARLLVVTDTMPDGMSFVYGSRGSTADGQVVTWPSTSIPVGGTLVDTIRVRMPLVTGNHVNVAAALGRREDPDLTDNRSEFTTFLTQPDLQVVKTHTGDFTVGAEGTYLITVANNGDGTAYPPTIVTDTLPAGLTFTGGSGVVGSWQVAADGQVVTATLGSELAPGASRSFSITALVEGAAVPSVINVARVAGEREANLANNMTTDSARVLASDLVATKSSDASFTEGVPGTYRITVRNIGDGVTTSPVVVTDTLQTGLSFVSGASMVGAWTFATSGPVVTATHAATLAPGDSASLTMTVMPGMVAVPSVDNLATVSGGGQVNLDNDTTERVTTPVTGVPDLTVAKTSGALTYGSPGTYGVTVTNVGGAGTSGTIIVTDTLPAGLTFVSGAGSDWSFTPSAGNTIVTATYTGAPLAALGGTAAFTLSVNVLSTAPSVTNRVQVAGEGETNTTNNVGSVTTAVTAQPDLAIAKTGPPGMVVGSESIYTITVTNVGLAPTAGTITVADTLPATLEYRSRNNGTFSGTSRSGQVVTGTYTGALSPGASISFTITVRPLAGAPPSVTNVAHVSGGSDVNPANNTATLTTPVAAEGAASDLVVTKASSSFAYGQVNATYTITVGNVGGTTTGSNLITVTDTLPSGIAYMSGGGADWTLAHVVAPGGRSVVTATRTKEVKAGEDASVITLTVSVSSGAVSPVTNTAWVSGGGETNTTNNSGSVTTAIQRGDLTVTKTSETFSYGANRDYTITVGNAGPGGSYGLVTVVDTLPVGLTYLSASGTGWTTSAVNTAGRWIVTATSSQGVLAGANYSPLTIEVNVTIQTVSPVTNTARVSGGNETNNTNNSGSVTTTITGADLSIAKTTPLPMFVPGEATQYTLTVTALGTTSASGSSGSPIMVRDTLPVGIRPTSISLSGFNTSSLDSVSVPGRYIVTANRTSNLNAGTSATVTIQASVTTAAMPSVLNRAWVSGSNNGNPANDSSSVLTPVATPDLTLSKTAVGTFYVGGAASYRIVVRNIGTLATFTGITVTDPLPTGITFVPAASAGNGWAFSSAGQTVTATYSGPPLAPNDSSVITLGVSIGNEAAGTVSNTATVAGGGEVNAANNTSTVVTAVGAQSDLTLTKTSGTFSFGSNGTYSLQVNNIGSTATSALITVVDTLPTGLAFVPASGSGPGWTVSATGNVVTATRSDPIEPGASSTFTFEVSIGAAAVPSVLNRAWVSGGGQLNTTNDGASLTTPVLAPDLVVDKAAGALEAQEQGTYTITVTNAGTAATTEPFTVLDDLPGSLVYVSAAGTGWNIVTTDQMVTATYPGTLDPGASATFTITVLVMAPAGTEITNSASVAGGGEAVTDNNTDPVTVTVGGTPDLVIAKALESGLVQNQGGSYTLTVTNTGNGSTAGPIVVTDELPAGLEYAASTAHGWVISAVGQAVTATWSGSLDPGTSVGFTLNVAVTAPGGTELTNVATVSGGGEENTVNNTSPQVSDTVTAADLVATKAASSPLVIGSSATYVITVTNGGDAATAGDIVVTDTIPAGIAYIAGSAEGTGWTFAFDGVENVLTATFGGVLVPGQSEGFSFDVEVTAAYGVEVVNRAHVAGGSDGDAGNNMATSVETVGGLPVLQVTKVADPDAGVFQQGFTSGYLITVTNVGQVATSAPVTVTDTLSAGLSYVSAAAPGWTVTVTGQVVEAVYGNVPALGVGQSAQFTFQVAVSALGGTEITNRVHASGGGASEPASDSVTLTVMGRPNLLLTKAALTQNPGFASPGEDVTYTITFTNNGTEAAWEVTVTDLLPTEVWFMTGSASALLPVGIGARLEYSEDDGQSWSETPPAGPCGARDGYSACVTGLRLFLTNPLPSGEAGNFIFLVRVP